MDSVLRAAAIYLVLMVLFKIAGRRSLAELTTFDLVLFMVIGEATQQALLGDDFSLVNAVLVIVTLIAIDIGFSLVKQRSLGFSRRQLLARVQLPLALRFALPSLINNLIDLVKMTAVASAIAVGDVTYQSIMIWTQRDNVLELLLLILLWFGLLTWLLSLAGRWLEQRLRMPGYGQ